MRVAAIINSRVGRAARKRLLTLLRSEFKSAEFAAAFTEYAGHATELATRFSAEGFDTIVACGGDGTVNEIVNGIDLDSCSLVIIPMGTANDLAGLYRLPSAPESALSELSSGRVHKQDLISVNGWRFATVGGLGLGSTALQFYHALRRHFWISKIVNAILGQRLYSLGLALALTRRRENCISACLEWESGRLAGEFDSIVFGNQDTLGNQFRVLPKAANDDGYFEAFTIEAHLKTSELLSVIRRVQHGTHCGSRHVACIRCRKLLITLDKPAHFFGDGEIGGFTNRLEICIEGRALRVLVPKRWRAPKQAQTHAHPHAGHTQLLPASHSRTASTLLSEAVSIHTNA